MKNIFTLFTAVFLILVTNTSKLKAQADTVLIQSTVDSSWSNNCEVPDTVDFFIQGLITGLSFDSVDVYINFGDGTDTTFKATAFQLFHGWCRHIYRMAGEYQVQYIVSAPTGAADTLVDQVSIGVLCGDISGSLYVDSDNDCVKDSGEQAIQWFVRALNNGNVVALTKSDVNGDYFLHLPTASTYTVEVSNSNFTVSCPPSGVYTVSSLPSTGNDFGKLCIPTFDLTTYLVIQGFRRGVSSNFFAVALNKILSCTPQLATVTITLDPLLTFDSSDVAPVSVNGQTLVFNAGQLSALSQQQWTTWIAATTSLSANIGDTLCITVKVDPLSGDLDSTNNTMTFCSPVRNSYDPNEKSEEHIGSGTGNVLPGTELDYTILFQNLGNDDAYNIVVVDELDTDLDFNTLRITGASHNYNVTMAGNTLRFTFNNINLPAASVNEPASHGYITYSIYPKSTAALGTVIENHAEIYFDFNPAIVTNTVTNILATATGVNEINRNEVSVYPNPVFEDINIGSEETVLQISIYDIAGKLVYKTNGDSVNKIIHVKDLPSGFYNVIVETPSKVFRSKIIVKH